jgi:hypothetical protein
LLSSKINKEVLDGMKWLLIEFVHKKTIGPYTGRLFLS